MNGSIFLLFSKLGDAIAELDRFLIVYPLNAEIAYAKYLLALCYYEQIVDEKDLSSTGKFPKNFYNLLKIIQIQIMH